MIRAGCAEDFNIWSHSDHMCQLYRDRARDAEAEMTCAAQAAELLAPIVRSGESLLDAGCGSGWFFHSLRRRGMDLIYWGLDRTEPFIRIGREELCAFGLPPERLMIGALEYVQGAVDHVVCMNVLTNIDNWHRGLDRMAAVARRSLILRESLADHATYGLVEDCFLNPGVHLKVHVNTYPRHQVMAFLEDRGFMVRTVVDRRTGGEPELVIGYPHHWTFLVAERSTAAVLPTPS